MYFFTVKHISQKTVLFCRYMNRNPTLLPEMCRPNVLNERCLLCLPRRSEPSTTYVAHHASNVRSQCHVGRAPCRQPVIRYVRSSHVVRTTQTSCDRLTALRDCHRAARLLVYRLIVWCKARAEQDNNTRILSDIYKLRISDLPTPSYSWSQDIKCQLRRKLTRYPAVTEMYADCLVLQARLSSVTSPFTPQDLIIFMPHFKTVQVFNQTTPSDNRFLKNLVVSSSLYLER
jgi:hypothetical protein